MPLDSSLWKFIFEALKPEPDTCKLVKIASEGFGEYELITICRDHGILLIINDSLKMIAQQIFTAKGLEQWRAAVASCTLQSLELHRELQRLLPLFAEAGVPVMPFKGPMLSEKLFGDLLLRMSADLDLLVPREHVAEVVELLADNGYMSEFDCRDLERWLKPNARYFHCGLVSDNRKWLVEIHWELFAGWRKTHLLPSTGEECFPGGVGDVMETLLYLCNHGAHHWWIELKWVVDVDRCVRSARDLKWEELFNMAGDHGCLRVVYLALVLAQQVCGLELPELVKTKIRKDRRTVELAGRVSQNWSLPKSQGPSLLWKLHYLLDCRERWSDKLGMIINYPILRSLPAFVSKQNH